MNKEEIIKRLSSIFKDKNYDYSLVVDTNVRDYIWLICPIHGKFRKRLQRALEGKGCPKCSGKIVKTFEEFESEADKIHNGKYMYVGKYINSHTKISIVCPIHGVFHQTPTNHLNGNGCPKCKREKLKNDFSLGKEIFVKKSRIVHGNKYDYSKVTYVNNNTEVTIGCPIHGEFLQTPYNHMKGHGCPHCKESHLEREIRHFLNENNISYEYQWHLPWSKYYSLDFYIKDYNIGIECQGSQHHEKNHFFEPLEEIEKRDAFKFNSCIENGIKVVYYSNIKHDGWINDRDKLLEVIKNQQVQGS